MTFKQLLVFRSTLGNLGIILKSKIFKTQKQTSRSNIEMNRFRGVRANLHLHVNLHFGVFSDFIFFWFKLTNFCFQSPNQKFGFSACCVWVGKGICPGRKLVIRWFFVCFKTFFPVIIRFMEVESCRELCSFKWCFFFPHRV